MQMMLGLKIEYRQIEPLVGTIELVQTVCCAAGVTGEGQTGAGAEVQDGVLWAGELGQHHVAGGNLLIIDYVNLDMLDEPNIII